MTEIQKYAIPRPYLVSLSSVTGPAANLYCTLYFPYTFLNTPKLGSIEDPPFYAFLLFYPSSDLLSIYVLVGLIRCPSLFGITFDVPHLGVVLVVILSSCTVQVSNEDPPYFVTFGLGSNEDLPLLFLV